MPRGPQGKQGVHAWVDLPPEPEPLSVQVNPDRALDTLPAAAEPEQSIAEPAAAERTWVQTAMDALPMLGGAVGGSAGGVPGAFLGGMAGSGYQQLLQSGAELPGAVRDILGTIGPHPGAVMEGFRRGGAQGLGQSAEAGALQGLLDVGGNLVMGGLGRGARAAYGRLLKGPLRKVSADKARTAVDAALRAGIPIPDTKGKAQIVLRDLNDQATTILENSRGQTVDLHSVADRLRAWASKKYNIPGQAPENYELALSVADRIDRHPSLGIPDYGPAMARVSQPGSVVREAVNRPLPVDLPTANRTKIALSQSVKPNEWGIRSGPEATTAKVGQSMLRQEIMAAAPDVGPILAREGPLIEAARAIQKARTPNWSPTILSVGGGAGYGLYRRNPAAGITLGLALRVGMLPSVASRAAIVASRLADAMPGAALADVARVAIVTTQEAMKQEGHPTP